MIDYQGRRFKSVSTSQNSEAEQVVFHYHQHANILTCSYSGGSVKAGHLIGLVSRDGSIDMVYHQVNDKGMLRTGKCHSKPEMLSDGRIRLHEKWQWSEDSEIGHTTLEEII